MLQDLLWTEKYRPKRIEDMALEAELRKVFRSFLRAKEIPHLLLVGPPGVGKTTTARILIAELDCRVLGLNASVERGIDVVREKIGAFVTASFGARWNVVFLDEADAMTAEAQNAMRNLIETYADRSRFILTANYAHRIIGPIQSRCQVLPLGRPPLKERYRILCQVLEAEGITATPAVALGYAERYPDLRKMLMEANRAYLTTGLPGQTLPPPVEEDRTSGAEILQAVEEKNWTRLRHICATGEFDHHQGLRDLFWAIPDDHPKVGFLRHVVGRGCHESGFTPDITILFLAVCAEASEGLGG